MVKTAKCHQMCTPRHAPAVSTQACSSGQYPGMLQEPVSGCSRNQSQDAPGTSLQEPVSRNQSSGNQSSGNQSSGNQSCCKGAMRRGAAMPCLGGIVTVPIRTVRYPPLGSPWTVLKQLYSTCGRCGSSVAGSGTGCRWVPGWVQAGGYRGRGTTQPVYLRLI